MPKNQYFKLKNSNYPLSSLISVSSPDLYYSVQQALQNEGILLIDLYTGNTIEGQVNISMIGMVIGTKTATSKRKMGFVQSGQNATEPGKRDLDAILIFEPSLQQDGAPMSLTIQVVDFDDIPIWAKIALQVAHRFMIKEDGNRLCEVFFNLTSLSRSNGIDSSAKNAALHEIRLYPLEGTDSISYIPIPDDEQFYENEDQFNKQSKHK